MVKLNPSEAAARLERRDTLGIPLGTGQPPALLAALGERDDWEDLRVYGALLAVGTELFTRAGVSTTYLASSDPSSARFAKPMPTSASRRPTFAGWRASHGRSPVSRESA